MVRYCYSDLFMISTTFLITQVFNYFVSNKNLGILVKSAVIWQIKDILLNKSAQAQVRMLYLLTTTKTVGF